MPKSLKRTCTVQDCDGSYVASGYCRKHYSRNKRNGHLEVTRTHEIHGKQNTPEYQIWWQMKNRCRNINHKHYRHYGGRGIKVCDRWLNSFQAFIDDMGEKPPKHSLDRRDNDGNYEPNNCRWATSTQQVLNRRPIKNTSGYIGVSWVKSRRRWSAIVTKNYKAHCFGYFSNISDAVAARDKGAFELHGADVRLNHA